MALGGVLVGIAFSAQHLVVLGGERHVHQGLLAFEAVEALLVPVAILIGQVLLGGERVSTSGYGQDPSATWGGGAVYYILPFSASILDPACKLPLGARGAEATT